jgi:hypothetical protein
MGHIQEHMSDDFLHQARNTNMEQVFEGQVFNKALRSIRVCLNSSGRDLVDYQLQTPAHLIPGEGNVLIDEVRGKYDPVFQAQMCGTWMESKSWLEMDKEMTGDALAGVYTEHRLP